jgi:hypothetical protein
MTFHEIAVYFSYFFGGMVFHAMVRERDFIGAATIVLIALSPLIPAWR